MATRNVRIIGDEVLKKTAKEVKEMTPKIKELIQDMFETMYEERGVGLAAPQVGILKRIVVIDPDYESPMALINPVILDSSGEQIGEEGCLSVPGKFGMVKRPDYVKVRACNEEMEEFTMEVTEYTARVICHELDHLDGILYVEKVIGELESTNLEE